MNASGFHMSCMVPRELLFEETIKKEILKPCTRTVYLGGSRTVKTAQPLMWPCDWKYNEKVRKIKSGGHIIK